MQCVWLASSWFLNTNERSTRNSEKGQVYDRSDDEYRYDCADQSQCSHFGLIYHQGIIPLRFHNPIIKTICTIKRASPYTPPRPLIKGIRVRAIENFCAFPI
jgi:hypothetical protein